MLTARIQALLASNATTAELLDALAAEPMIDQLAAAAGDDSQDSQDSQPAGDTAASQPALDDPKRFILAVSGTIAGAKAIFTLQGVSARYTFKVTRKDAEIGSRFTEPAYFVGLLTGPDNTSDYTYVGMLMIATGQIRLTKASRYTADSQPVKAFNWAISRVFAGKSIAPATIYHMGFCGRCGRALTVPESVAAGLGPECASKL